ncbi:RecQ family helicase [Pyrenophora teres f. teres]|uniref:RecQ family helicase n=1 Tax=Pyrenophora teres f. teres TaxID=97479 RepID=A0A6S6VVC8_9PLEO|nr:RecQ family helicase [Pyrenophora teres f. teres]
MWHRFLGLDGKQAAPQGTWTGSIDPIRRVLGQQDVGFRWAEQELALHAVIDGQTRLVVVLPTGRGKSLLFSVPACMDEAGVTVVVVPYRALVEDLVDRMQKCGIDCIEWKHGESSPAAIVVVSADAAGDTTSWQQACWFHAQHTYIRASTVTQFELTELTAKTQFSQSVLEVAGH